MVDARTNRGQEDLMGEHSIIPERRIVVLGVGNLLWADEGFGVRCVEALGDGWDFSPPIEVLDGGTLGLALVPLLLDATHVLLFDAVDHRGEPGSLLVARDAEVPRFMTSSKMSLHQAGMNDILASLELLGHKPASFTVIGIKPVELADYGGSLTEAVQQQVPVALQLGIEELAGWGVEARERADGTSRETVIAALARERYESGRPSAELACRVGDERFLARRAVHVANEAADKGAHDE
jgi:hydrogenase maturation protease